MVSIGGHNMSNLKHDYENARMSDRVSGNEKIEGNDGLNYL